MRETTFPLMPSVPSTKPLAASVGRRATTKLCADQSIRLIAADQEEVFIASIEEHAPTVNAGVNS